MLRIAALLLIFLPNCSAPVSGAFANASNEESGLAAEVIHWVNVEREKEGLGPLSNNAPLAKVAFQHSADMLKRDYFDHINPEGDGPLERVNAAGIKYSALGENVGKGFLSAQEAVIGWMGSPPHRANILDPGFTQIGVGVALSDKDSNLTLWTQLFRTP